MDGFGEQISPENIMRRNSGRSRNYSIYKYTWYKNILLELVQKLHSVSQAWYDTSTTNVAVRIAMILLPWNPTHWGRRSREVAGRCACLYGLFPTRGKDVLYVHCLQRYQRCFECGARGGQGGGGKMDRVLLIGFLGQFFFVLWSRARNEKRSICITVYSE